MGQSDIIDNKPGDTGYSDYRVLLRVTPPRDYLANDFKSFEEVAQYKLVPSNTSKSTIQLFIQPFIHSLIH